MASALFGSFKKLALDGDIDLPVDTIKVALLDTATYIFSSAHDFYDDVSGVVGTPQTLGAKTTTGGVFDAANATFTAVTGASVEALVIYKDTGVPATSPLIAYIDGLSVTPNGGDISVNFHASGIFAL